jgi:hypothetical protein
VVLDDLEYSRKELQVQTLFLQLLLRLAEEEAKVPVHLVYQEVAVAVVVRILAPVHFQLVQEPSPHSHNQQIVQIMVIRV